MNLPYLLKKKKTKTVQTFKHAINVFIFQSINRVGEPKRGHKISAAREGKQGGRGISGQAKSRETKKNNFKGMLTKIQSFREHHRE